MKIPAQIEIEHKLRDEDLNSWLELWRTEQGPAKPAALTLITGVIPFPADQSLRVLDVGCGPGDAGRLIYARFPHAQIDFIDKNEFFAALCAAVNRRDGIPSRTFLRDVSQSDWQRDLPPGYDVVVAVNAVHWLTLAVARQLFSDLFQALRPGGVFLLMEPVTPEPPFAPGYDTWRKQLPSQHKYEDWRRFWSRVQTLTGYDYGFLGEPGKLDRIGDELSVMHWIRLLTDAGFDSIDVLLRDPEKAVLACRKPS